jgi:hypothetical protein
MPRHHQAHRRDHQDHHQQADHGRDRARRMVGHHADDRQGGDQHEHAGGQE